MDFQTTGLLVLLPLLTVIAVQGYFRYRDKSALNSLQEELDKIKDKTSHLWQYEAIVDADEEAKSIREEVAAWEKQKKRAVEKESEDALAKGKADVARIIANAKSDALDIERYAQQDRQSLLDEAKKIRQEAKEVREKATARNKVAAEKAAEIVSEAHTTATGIVEQARTQAENIAGSAIEAKEHAESYEATASAMRNLIDGYGDEYIIPNHHVLDDLAEEFEHKDAGKKLKECRQVTKSMVVAGKAADCDYVEPKRKKTAVHFVLDAFNGKVDTTMTKVKKDNFGKLTQEIKDANALVNHHGAAFRNARITDTYLQARINELKWAVATEELRLKEREEQQAIKAKIREEERAQKEFEKAQREAEKEERMLEKAMEKARKELAKASEEEKARYEEQLAELQTKWEEAESRNQRAMSMAQQTRTGHVYVISNIGSFGENVFKVGMTRRLEPMDRVKELGDASVPFNFDVHAMIYSEDAPRLENELHRRFGYCRMNRVNLRREFFKVTLSELRQVVEELNIEAHWTMKAEAAQYRESLVIAKEEQEALQAAVIA
ncbi:GIY-YIG nuclease family protein [Ferrimonas kyonanensis]|uniref:GIY-YIG nuclease family protein n=1 Tax=Ferrimonas kyonanensis TaxID=364763 RepID=UPI0003FFD29C|nr:GIY-YIG nuclease family protein [Ferrimonas kyonanensis]